MRTTKRTQKTKQWSDLDLEQRKLAKQRRLYVMSPVYPAGRYLIGKAKEGR